MLYNHLFFKAQQCGFVPHNSTLDTLLDDVKDWGKCLQSQILQPRNNDQLTCALDIDEYLPLNTLCWCNAKLLEITDNNLLALTQFDIFPNRKCVYKAVYFQLQVAIAAHLENEAELKLQECTHPTRRQDQLSPPADMQAAVDGDQQKLGNKSNFELKGDGLDIAADEQDFNFE